jgi:hypothetical protein
MLSYPFFWDQPALARRCAELGIAVPLARDPRAPIAPRDVDAAVDEALARGPAMRARLDEARTWEERVVALRPAVTRRILGLARDGRPPRPGPPRGVLPGGRGGAPP